MPRTYRKRPYRKRPFYRKRRSYRKKNSTSKVTGSRATMASKRLNPVTPRVRTMPTNNGDLVPRMRLKMAYSDVYRAHAPGTAGDQHIYYINNIYDPDLTSATGSSATLHDAMATLYNRYKVYGAKIDVSVRNTTTAPVIAGLIIGDTNTAGMIEPDKIRRSAHSSAILGGNSSDNNTAKFSAYVNFKKMIGDKIADSNMSANFGSSPTDLIYCNLAVSSIDGSNVTYVIDVVNIIFYVQVDDPLWDRSLD